MEWDWEDMSESCNYSKEEDCQFQCSHGMALGETLFSVGFGALLVCFGQVHCGLIISGVEFHFLKVETIKKQIKGIQKAAYGSSET